MQTALIILGVAALYVIVSTLFLQLLARVAAGIVPTFGSAAGAFLVNLMLSLLALFVATRFDILGSIAFLPFAIVLLLVQTMVYTVMLRDSQGAEISYGRALLIMVCQVIMTLGMQRAAASLPATSGLTAAYLAPRQGLPWAKPSRTPAPQAVVPSTRWGTLTTSVVLPTKYGHITYNAGSQIEVVRETGSGYVVRFHGAEFTATREQVLLRP